MAVEHKHLHELISALADGTLTPEEAAQVQLHMKDCPDCRQLLHDIRRIGTAIGEEGVPPVPANLAGRIRERVTGHTTPTLAPASAVPIWRSPFPLAAAATLLLVSVIWLAWPRGASRSTPLDQETDRPDSGAPPSPQAKSIPPSSEKAPASSGILQHDAPPPQPLRKLGYLVEGGSNEPKPTAQTDSIEREYGALKEKSQAPAPVPRDRRSEELDRILSSGLTGEDYKKAERQRRADEAPVAKDAAAGAPLAAAPGSPLTVTKIHSLDYEGPDYSATFVEDGLITVVARGYACSADVPISKPGAGERGKSVEDLLSLFAAAGSRDFLGAPAPGEASAGASTLTLRDGEGNSIRSINFSDPLPEDTPKTLRGLRQAIGHLIKDRYRSEIEARCGPLPTRIVEAP